MHDEFVILIADRNRHVREFLKRELMAAGYQVLVARDGREVMVLAGAEKAPDLLILDLEIPYGGGFALVERLKDFRAGLPIVIHSFLSELSGLQTSMTGVTAFVEKNGDTQCLKTAVEDLLRRSYPDRFKEENRARIDGKMSEEK